MVAVGFAAIVLVFVVSIGGGLLLYALVRAERSNRTTTDRETAEQMARRDTDDRG